MARGSRIFKFGPFELDERAQELRCSGHVVPLHATPMRLLFHLLENRDRSVSKDSLLQDVWPDVAVSDTALSTALKQIRRALDDDGGRQRWIRTERGRGYRWIGDLVVDEPPLGPDASVRQLSGLPRAPSALFVGRQAELALLEQWLGDGRSVGAHVSVEGLAGIGKTELALQLAYRLAAQGEFPGGIFWLDAEDPDLLPTWGNRLAEESRIPGASSEERCRELLRRIEERKAPVLVVLDNVASWSSTQKPGPLPLGPHVCLLVTSRSRNLGGARFKHVEAGFLAHPHDRELVVLLAGRDPGAGLTPLLEHLAGHTLALELAGAFFATYAGESAHSYHLALQRKSDEVEAEVRDRVAYEATVNQAFRAVWERVDSSLREAWRLASCFAPEPASRELAEAAGITPQVLRSLEQLHLVRCAPDGRWSMHRLIRAFGGRVGDLQEIERARQRFLEGCFARALTIEDLTWQRIFSPDRAHFEAALRLAAELLADDARTLAEFRFRVAIALDLLGELEASRRMLHEVAAACRTLLASPASDRLPDVKLYGRLGDTYAWLAKHEHGTSTAEAAVQAYREVAHHIRRDERPTEWAHAQLTLGFALRRLGADRRDPALLEASVAAHRAALEEFTRERDPLRWGEAQLFLGSALMSLGELTDDVALLQQAELGNRTVIESQSRSETPLAWPWAHYRHAQTLVALGRREDGVKSLEEALRGFRTALGEWSYEDYRVNWMSTQSDIATVLLRIGLKTGDTERLDEALRTVRLVLATARPDPGSDRWADAQYLLGAILEALGATVAAGRYLEAALGAYRASLQARDRERFLHRWAETQYAIARVLRKLSCERTIDAQERLEALRRARDAWVSTSYREGIEAVDRERMKLATCGELREPD